MCKEENPENQPKKPNESEEKGLVKETRYLVYVTLLLFVVGIANMIVTCEKMGEQVEELRRSTDSTSKYMNRQVEAMNEATKLQWRPYLDLKINNSMLSAAYDISPDSVDTPETVRIDEFKVNSYQYRLVKQVILTNTMYYELKNIGSTPLRITRLRNKAITEKMWKETYKKSALLLCEDIKNESYLDSLEIDHVIYQDIAEAYDSITTGIINISKSDFEIYVNQKKKIITYPYIYAEYEDFFGNKYNSLIIYFQIYNMTIDDSIPVPTSVALGLEKYRWDLSLNQ